MTDTGQAPTDELTVNVYEIVNTFTLPNVAAQTFSLWNHAAQAANQAFHTHPDDPEDAYEAALAELTAHAASKTLLARLATILLPHTPTTRNPAGLYQAATDALTSAETFTILCLDLLQHHDEHADVATHETAHAALVDNFTAVMAATAQFLHNHRP